MEKLAIQGGKPVRNKPFPAYNTLDEREERAVVQVIRNGVISDFIGVHGPFFLGGHKVRELEEIYRKITGSRYAIAMNSATSVIIASMAAFGIGPGDEVIVTPYSHVISATAPLIFDAIPIFADSEPDMLCMSVDSIKNCITQRTKAIIVVDLFGQSADMEGINALAEKHGLMVLSDSAHISLAKYRGRMAGTSAHIGSYSLNGHKTLQCGEGGVAVTDNEELAMKLQLMRNHAENCVDGFGVSHWPNMLGYNFRMTELEAAVAVEQLKKAEDLVFRRRELCEYLSKGLQGIEGLTPPVIREGAEHDYLIYPIIFDPEAFSIDRSEFMHRLDAEGIHSTTNDCRHVPPVSAGFVRPIYHLPIFAQKTFRPHGEPWTNHRYEDKTSYYKGLCPVVENLHSNTLICVNAVYPPLIEEDIQDIIDGIAKVARLSR